MERKSVRTGYLLLLPSVILIAALIVYPAVNTIYQSFLISGRRRLRWGPNLWE